MVNNEGCERRIILTYESDTDKFVAAADLVGAPKTLNADSVHLPFALAARSYSDTVFADEVQTEPLNSRRELFMKTIIAALAPVMGMVSPAMAATTTYTSTPSTQSTKSQSTTYGTSGVTTQGGDNDTREDTRTDTVTDSKTDPTQDTKQDP